MAVNTDKSLKDHKKYQLQFSREDFCKHFNHPFLLPESESGIDGGGQRAFETLNIRPDQIKDFMNQADLKTRSSEVVRLVRKGTKYFEGMVKVGRVGNCDLVIKSPAISKLHAFFSKDIKNGSYYISDADSTNSTYVNNVILKPGEKKVLADGDVISFGRQVSFVFYTPEGCYDLLERLPETL